MVVINNFDHLGLGLLALAVILISIAPIRQIVDSERLSLGQRVYWSVVVVVVPVIGALIWWVSVRKRT
jgi:hypothetical protein